MIIYLKEYAYSKEYFKRIINRCATIRMCVQASKFYKTVDVLLKDIRNRCTDMVLLCNASPQMSLEGL